LLTVPAAVVGEHQSVQVVRQLVRDGNRQRGYTRVQSTIRAVLLLTSQRVRPALPMDLCRRPVLATIHNQHHSAIRLSHVILHTIYNMPWPLIAWELEVMATHQSVNNTSRARTSWKCRSPNVKAENGGCVDL